MDTGTSSSIAPGSMSARERMSMKYAGPTVVANPVAGMFAGAHEGGGRRGGGGGASESSFGQKLRRGTIATDVGFTTFESGIRAGWHEEINSKKFRQAVLAEFCATMIFVAMGTASVVFSSDAASMSGVLLSPNGTMMTSSTSYPSSRLLVDSSDSYHISSTHVETFLPPFIRYGSLAVPLGLNYEYLHTNGITGDSFNELLPHHQPGEEGAGRRSVFEEHTAPMAAARLLQQQYLQQQQYTRRELQNNNGDHTTSSSSSSTSPPALVGGTGIDTVISIQYGLPRWINISFCFGLMIGVLVFSTGSVSGGNLNPAVTISLAITQKMSSFRATCYVTAQCIGAALGAAFVRSLAPSLYLASGGAANTINWGKYVGTWTVVGGEMIGTALLVFTVCAAADVGREKNNKYQGALTPFIIGLAVLVAHLFLIPIDGCSINPARTFGTAIATGNFQDHWLFWMGPILGGILSALVYENLFKMYRDTTTTKGGNSSGSGGGGSSSNNSNSSSGNNNMDGGGDGRGNKTNTVNGSGGGGGGDQQLVVNQMRTAASQNDKVIDLSDAYAASSALGDDDRGRSSDWR